MTSVARRPAFWLSLALVACSPTTKTISDDAGQGGDISIPPPGGTAGRGTGGAAGTLVSPTGGLAGSVIDDGTSGTAGRAVAPTMNHAERFGRGVRVYFDDTMGAYELTCSGSETGLTKANGGTFVDNRPACSIPYYLDGRYEENVETFACYGCDYVTCEPFPSSMTFNVLEYVQTGVRPAPDDGAAGESGAGGGPPEIADFVSRVYPGPYELTIRYYTDPTCHKGQVFVRPPVAFALAVDGGGEGGAAGNGG